MKFLLINLLTSKKVYKSTYSAFYIFYKNLAVINLFPLLLN
jgi:hypothetical protein